MIYANKPTDTAYNNEACISRATFYEPNYRVSEINCALFA